jgi:hypothetical protein
MMLCFDETKKQKYDFIPIFFESFLWIFRKIGYFLFLMTVLTPTGHLFFNYSTPSGRHSSAWYSWLNTLGKAHIIML